jgi:hypothetical protein
MLPTLLKDFQIIHLCGKGNLDEKLTETPGYVHYEYINEELSDLLAAADLVISRAEQMLFVNCWPCESLIYDPSSCSIKPWRTAA